MFQRHNRMSRKASQMLHPSWWGWHVITIPALLLAGYALAKRGRHGYDSNEPGDDM